MLKHEFGTEKGFITGPCKEMGGSYLNPKVTESFHQALLKVKGWGGGYG